MSVSVPIGYGLVRDQDDAPTAALWVDADVLAMEHRTSGGLVLSASAGGTILLTEAYDGTGSRYATPERIDRRPFPQGRIGWAF